MDKQVHATKEYRDCFLDNMKIGVMPELSEDIAQKVKVNVIKEISCFDNEQIIVEFNSDNISLNVPYHRLYNNYTVLRKLNGIGVALLKEEFCKIREYVDDIVQNYMQDIEVRKNKDYTWFINMCNILQNCIQHCYNDGEIEDSDNNTAAVLLSPVLYYDIAALEFQNKIPHLGISIEDSLLGVNERLLKKIFMCSDEELTEFIDALDASGALFYIGKRRKYIINDYLVYNAKIYLIKKDKLSEILRDNEEEQK